MAQSIILNSTHIVPGSNNSRLRYNFPQLQNFKDMTIGLRSIDMYNSIFNINASLYNNNVFRYLWFSNTGTLSVQHTITIPDGYYDTISLNEYLQSQLILRTHYLTDGNGKNIFYLKMSDNINRYAVQLDAYVVPTDAQATAGIIVGGITYRYPTIRSNPTNWIFPSVNVTTPRFQFPTTSQFHLLIGYLQQEYPSTNNTTSQSFLSPNNPVQEPVSSIVCLCNLVRNELCNPVQTFSSFTLNSDFGYINKEQPNEVIFLKIQDGDYGFIELTFLDQQFRNIQIRDPQMLINILIKKKE